MKSFTYTTAGEALRAVQEARAKGLKASYHPKGGDTAKRYVPISHTVYVCEPAELEEQCPIRVMSPMA
jgi:hypothetical protein